MNTVGMGGKPHQGTAGEGDARRPASQARTWEAIVAALGEEELLKRGLHAGGAAEEHLQEAVLRVACKPASKLPSDPAMLKRYILGTARKIALQEAQWRSREEPAGLFTGARRHEAVSDRGLRSLEEEEERLALEQRLTGLRSTHRDLILLITEGASVRDLAGRLGKTPASVESHLRNARLAAREALERAWPPMAQRVSRPSYGTAMALHTVPAEFEPETVPSREVGIGHDLRGPPELKGGLRTPDDTPSPERWPTWAYRPTSQSPFTPNIPPAERRESRSTLRLAS